MRGLPDASSEDGGKTWTGLTWNSRGLFAKAFGDWRTMWIDPQNSNRMILGSDGGVSISYDGGKTADSVDFFLKETPAAKVTVADTASEVVRTLESDARALEPRVVGHAVRPERLRPAGDYTVTLQVGERRLVQKTRILPRHP